MLGPMANVANLTDPETRTRGINVGTFAITLLPICFIIEKDFLFGINGGIYLCAFVLSVLALLRRVSVSLILVLFLTVIAFNDVLISFWRPEIEAKMLVRPAMNLFFYIIAMLAVSSLMTDRKSFDTYAKSLTFCFYAVVALYALQMLSLLGIEFATSLNNALAPIYEARWAPFASMGESHIFYSSGSYVSTIGRINGFSKEASTFCIGLALNFLPVFFVLARLGEGGKKYRRFILLTIGMLISSLSSTGLVLGAIAFLLYIFLFTRSFARVAILFIGVIAAMFTASMLSDSYYIAKLSDLNSNSTQTRYGTVYAGLLALTESPVLGQGFLFYTDVYNLMPSWGYSFEFVNYYNQETLRVFSVPISLYGEFGLVAFLFILGFFTRLLYFSLRNKSKYKSADQTILIVFLSLFAASTINTSSYSHAFYYLSVAIAYTAWKNGTRIFGDAKS